MRVYNEPFVLPDDIIEGILDRDTNVIRVLKRASLDEHKTDFRFEIVVKLWFDAVKYRHEDRNFVIIVIMGFNDEPLFVMFLPFHQQHPWQYDLRKHFAKPNIAFRPLLELLQNKYGDKFKEYATKEITEIPKVKNETLRITNRKSHAYHGHSTIKVKEAYKKAEKSGNLEIQNIGEGYDESVIDIHSSYIDLREEEFNELIRNFIEKDYVIYDPFKVLNIKEVK